MRVVVEPHRRLVEAPLALHPDVVGAVDHDLGHAVVGEEPLERAVAEDVVGDLRDEPVAVVARDADLVGELRPDVRLDPLAQGDGVHARVEELRAQVSDDGEVDPVLQLRERVAPAARGRARGTCGGESLVEFHYRLLASSRRVDFGVPFVPLAGAASAAASRNGR